jgi:UDP-N-acetyl-D-glucosamine dehydrogenase
MMVTKRTYRAPRLRVMRLGIMGLGYVGLPLVVAFAEQGHDVVGVDARKVEALSRGSRTSRTSTPAGCKLSRRDSR